MAETQSIHRMHLGRTAVESQQRAHLITILKMMLYALLPPRPHLRRQCASTAGWGKGGGVQIKNSVQVRTPAATLPYKSLTHGPALRRIPDSLDGEMSVHLGGKSGF